MPNTPKPRPPKLNSGIAAGEAPPRPTQGLAVAGNLVACVLVGMLLGWGVDFMVGSTPWGLMIGLFLGFGAWVRELWRLLNPPPQA